MSKKNTLDLDGCLNVGLTSGIIKLKNTGFGLIISQMACDKRVEFILNLLLASLLPVALVMLGLIVRLQQTIK